MSQPVYGEDKRMRIGLRAASLTASILICLSVALAQNPASTEQSIESLRAQLLEAQGKEAELQARDQQLDEDLRPENIERSLALTGSTHPEELREQRRRQLEAEKARVRAQLDLLETSRTRLEAAIARAEAGAYGQSVVTTTTTATTSSLGNLNSAGGVNTIRRPRRSRARRQLPRRYRRRNLRRRHR
jgi:hypothetical protein